MKIGGLLKWFLIWLFAMVVIIFFTLPNERPQKIDTVSFETTESAELYFKNVRAFYYSTHSEGHGVFEVYRLNSIFKDSANSYLPFALYSDWRGSIIRTGRTGSWSIQQAYFWPGILFPNRTMSRSIFLPGKYLRRLTRNIEWGYYGAIAIRFG
jgi:hypothetical protein